MTERMPRAREWHEHLAGWARGPADARPRRPRCATTSQRAPPAGPRPTRCFAVAAVALGADPGGTVPTAQRPTREPRRSRSIAAVAPRAPDVAGCRASASAALVGAAAVVALVVVGVGDDGPAPVRGERRCRVRGRAVGCDGRRRSSPRIPAARSSSSTATGLDPDVTYALWLSPPGGADEDRIAAGTFRPDDRGRRRRPPPLRAARRAQSAASGPPLPTARSPSTPSDPARPGRANLSGPATTRDVRRGRAPARAARWRPPRGRPLRRGRARRGAGGWP